MSRRGGSGDQTWPYVRHIVGEGTEAVTASEWTPGELVVRGQGVDVHDDGTLTIAGSNVEPADESGELRFVGKGVR